MLKLFNIIPPQSIRPVPLATDRPEKRASPEDHLINILFELTSNKQFLTHDFQETDDGAEVLLLRGSPVRRRYFAAHPGHKPPAFTDTPSGRYAGSLFSAASRSSALQTVAEDLTHLRSVLKESAPFREVLKNSSVRRSKQKEIFGSFAPKIYSQVTLNFIDTLIDSGR